MAYFFQSGTSRSEVYPFVICAIGTFQDKVIIGPQILGQLQGDFIEWLYENVSDSLQPGQSGFRIGDFKKLSTAARFAVVNVKEAVSNRRNMTICFGLCREGRGYSGSLSRQLGTLLLDMAETIAQPPERSPPEIELQLLTRVAEEIVQGGMERDWAEEAGQMLSLCEMVKTERARSTLHWPFSKPLISGFIADNPISLARMGYLASQIFKGAAAREITIFDSSLGVTDGSMILGKVTANPMNSIVFLERSSREGALLAGRSVVPFREISAQTAEPVAKPDLSGRPRYSLKGLILAGIAGIGIALTYTALLPTWRGPQSSSAIAPWAATLAPTSLNCARGTVMRVAVTPGRNFAMTRSAGVSAIETDPVVAASLKRGRQDEASFWSFAARVDMMARGEGQSCQFRISLDLSRMADPADREVTARQVARYFGISELILPSSE